MTGKRRLRVAALKGLAGSIIATLAVRGASIATLDIPPEFLPLSSAGPTIVFTAVSALGAAAVFGVVRRRTERPEYVFRWIAAVILLLTFVPDLWLLSDGAAAAFPGATPTAVGVLMLMHVVAATVIVGFLTAKGTSPTI